jgi:hypothetical protein
MEINELNKKQLILLTLLITFVVSIATGIITVSLMNQMPKSVPQIVNNVIQRTIEKVVPQDNLDTSKDIKSDVVLNSQDNYIVSVFSLTKDDEIREFNDGVIISTDGLLLVDSTNIDTNNNYLVSLDSKYFSLSLLKNFSSFSIFKIGSLYENNNLKDKKDNETLEKSSSVE